MQCKKQSNDVMSSSRLQNTMSALKQNHTVLVMPEMQRMIWEGLWMNPDWLILNN